MVNSLIVCLILTVGYPIDVQAVSDAELEALEKQIDKLEVEEKEQAEAKRKVEQKRKAEAETKRKVEEARLAELERRRLDYQYHHA